MVKMNTGQRWLESTPYPPWDAVHKCPLWSVEEWKVATTTLAKRVLAGDVELNDDKAVVLRNYEYSSQMGYQTSYFRLLWTITLTPHPTSARC